MRYGVLADIHGNLHALDAALATLRQAGAHTLLCAGDLVGYGPFPNECVERVAQTGAVCVAGNHDLIALGRLPDDQCIPLARRSLEWTAAQLAAASRDFLGTLPLRAEAPGGIVMAHGSLDDPRCYVTRPDQADAQLAQLEAEHPQARVLILGHTHRAWAHARCEGALPTKGAVRLPGPPALLNPGAVGQSRERLVRARCLVLDTEAREACFLAVRYDVSACRRALLERGLPAASCHLRPSPLGACARMVRRAARRALSLSGR